MTSRRGVRLEVTLFEVLDDETDEQIELVEQRVVGAELWEQTRPRDIADGTDRWRRSNAPT